VCGMIHDTTKRAVELCLAMYRVTDKFPEGEILSQKLRSISVDIIELTVYKVYYPKEKLRVLFLNFEVADRQNWVDSKNFEILKQAYIELYKEALAIKIKKPEARKKRTATSISRTLTDRQQEIMDFLEKNQGGVTAPTISKAIKKSSRTVLRELGILLESRFIIRHGKTKGAKFFTP
jgi:Fic family protein